MTRYQAPEHEGIYTFMDCRYHSECTNIEGQRAFVERQGIYDTHHCGHPSYRCGFDRRGVFRSGFDRSGCSVNRALKRCPRGYA